MGWAERANPNSMRNLSPSERKEKVSIFRVWRERLNSKQRMEERNKKIERMKRSKELYHKKIFGIKDDGG